MNEGAYKNTIINIVALLKKIALEANSWDRGKDYHPDYIEGMKMAYYNVMDNIIELLNDDDIPLAEVGLADYKPIEILYGKGL